MARSRRWLNPARGRPLDSQPSGGPARPVSPEPGRTPPVERRRSRGPDGSRKACGRRPSKPSPPPETWARCAPWARLTSKCLQKRARGAHRSDPDPSGAGRGGATWRSGRRPRRRRAVPERPPSPSPSTKTGARPDGRLPLSPRQPPPAVGFASAGGSDHSSDQSGADARTGQGSQQRVRQDVGPLPADTYGSFLEINDGLAADRLVDTQQGQQWSRVPVQAGPPSGTRRHGGCDAGRCRPPSWPRR